jgi:hypothetical protein
MAGNTKLIESITLKELLPKQELADHSTVKSFTRHWCNIYLYLDPTECALFSWLVGYSDQVNVFTYSTTLLQQFDKASDRAMEIYGVDKVKYKTSRDNARMTFISLVEKGLLIRIKGKNRFMINPYIVYPSNHRKFNRASRHKEYLDIIEYSSADKLAGELTEYCNDIEKIFKEYRDKYGNR